MHQKSLIGLMQLVVLFFNKNIHRIKIDDDVAEWLDKKGFAEHFDRFINQLLRQTMQKEQLS